MSFISFSVYLYPFPISNAGLEAHVPVALCRDKSTLVRIVRKITVKSAQTEQSAGQEEVGDLR